MVELLKYLPADTVQAFLASLAIILGAIVVWILRKILSYLESLKIIKGDEATLSMLDRIGELAVNATNQYFKKFSGAPNADLSADKLNYALKQARLNLPPQVSQKINDAQLKSVLEAHVAKAKVASTPPSTVISLLPTDRLPPPAKTPDFPES